MLVQTKFSYAKTPEFGRFTVDEGAFLYSVSSRKRIFESAKPWCYEREQNKEKSDKAKHGKGQFWRGTAYLFGAKEPRFVNIRASGANIKNSDIEKIGGSAYYPVVSIEYHGYKNDPEKDAAQFDAPKIPALAEEEALYGGVNKQRPEKQLHMLPGGFVHA